MSDASPSLECVLEGALLASSEPLNLDRLESLFDDHERPLRGEIRAALTRLGNRLEGTAMQLNESSSGFRLAIVSELSPWVSRLWEERPQRYSRALLETLALIAYRQPVTRSDIEEVRGVSISATIMRTLMERGWIRVVGHRDVPGRPAVYATTRTFLDDLGLRTLEELPPMAELAEQFAEQPAGEPDEDAESRAAREATQALLEGNAEEEQRDDDGGEHGDPLTEPLPQVARLDFGSINERLDQRLSERQQRQQQDAATPKSAEDESSANTPEHDGRSLNDD